MTASRLSSIVFGLVVLSTLAWPYGERAASAIWNERLFVPDIVTPIARHTLLTAKGTVLPLTFHHNTTLTVTDSPYVLLTTSLVPKDVTLTIEPGTTIAVSEFGQITVEGTLEALGTKEKPILFTSNEENLANQTWNGIILAGGSQAILEYVRIFQASPGISCATGSQARIVNAYIDHGSMGMFSASDGCVVKDSTIKGRISNSITNY